MTAQTGKRLRIEVPKVETLGDLIDLVDLARSTVDQSMTNQTQAETPIKVDVSFGGKIVALKLFELAPDRIGREYPAPYLADGGFPEDGPEDFRPEDAPKTW